MLFSDDRASRGGERCERSNGRSVGRKLVIQAATWVGALLCMVLSGRAWSVERKKVHVRKFRESQSKVYGKLNRLKINLKIKECGGGGGKKGMTDLIIHDT